MRPRGLAAHGSVAMLASLVLLAPMLVTERTFGVDWSNHLWVMYAQGEAIKHGGPTLFLNADGVGVFYPQYAFYGGTLYAIGGFLAILAGPVGAYLIMWLAGFLMAYVGMLWIGLQAGLRDWQAHVAPLIVVTSAYYIANAYARGTWPELIAVSAIPLLLASALQLYRGARIHLGTATVFVASLVIFTGSHNVTLVWGSITIGLLAVVALATMPGLRPIPRDRVLVIIGLGVAAIAINAWFLLPDLAYGTRTMIGAPGNGLAVVASDWFANPGNVFNPLRATPPESSTPGLDTQLPVLILVWVVCAGALGAWLGRRSRVRFAALLLASILVFLSAMLLLKWPWDHLPHTLSLVQFTFRLESYIAIVLGLLVIALLLVLRQWSDRRPRLARAVSAGLIAAVAVGCVQAVVQAWNTPSFQGNQYRQLAKPMTRSQAVEDPHKVPPLWAAPPDYNDRVATLADTQSATRFDPRAVKDHRARARVVVRRNESAIATNVAAGPYLARVFGAPVIGRTRAGNQVVAVTPGAKTLELRAEPSSTPPVVLGRAISVAALVALLATALLAATRSRRKRSTKAP